jgi:hypothetical protein
MKASIFAIALGFSALGIPVAACIVENTNPANQANVTATNMDRCPYYPSPVVCGQRSGPVAAKAVGHTAGAPTHLQEVGG